MEIKKESMSLSIKDGFIHEKSLPDLEKILETRVKEIDSKRVYIGKELSQDVLLVTRVSVFNQPYTAENIKKIIGREVKPGIYHRVEIDIAGPLNFFVNGELETLVRYAGILHFPSPQEFFGEDYYREIFRRISEMEKLYSRN